MSRTRDEREKHLRKAVRSIVFGLGVLCGLAAYKIAGLFPQLEDFETLLGLAVGATVFAVLRRVLL